MAVPRGLPAEALYTHTTPEIFDFQTTAEIADGVEIIGQERAVESVRFAVGMDHDGYNLFAFGPPGIGKQFVVQHFLEQEARRRPAPGDLCYVNNFVEPNKPTLLRLPAGMGAKLKASLDELIEEIATALPAAFESDEYQARLQSVQQSFKEEHEKDLERLHEKAQSLGMAMLQTPMGIVFAPAKNGDVMSQEEYGRLPEAEQKRLAATIEMLQGELQAILRKLPRSERAFRNRARELNQEITEYALGHAIDELKQQYAGHDGILRHLDAVRQDLIHHARALLQPPEAQAAGPAPAESPLARRYQVNVLVDNGAAAAAPVVYEDHPIYENLVGRIEHLTHMGTLITDFNLIKPGALHHANGGFLLLDARRVLMQPYAWEGLKRALQSRQIRIETPGRALGLVSTVTLEPEPAALDLKVVLYGDPSLYYLLCQFDPDFPGLFKVAADFDDRFTRTDENVRHYARLVAEMARKHRLRPFDRGAVARLVEHGARQAGDAERLSAHVGRLADLCRECDYWAGAEARDVVAAAHVERAIEARVFRSSRVRERLREEVLRGTIAIDTAGVEVGQVNGLAVLQLGEFAFGKVSRITARVRLGKGEVVNIEREVELSGPIHSKGVLILAGFLGARYAAERPLSLSATLVFEQSYGGVDGDSASSTELYALLSALAEVPLRQSLAVTGSVNQRGQVQAIGGVNEKIEGFFDLCQARGLTGEQGVLIPAANVKHLMLRRDVVEAVAAGRFHVYPVGVIDEGLTLLTGLEAGARLPSGEFPPETVNGRVEQRLRRLAEAQAAFGRPASEAPPEAK